LIGELQKRTGGLQKPLQKQTGGRPKPPSDRQKRIDVRPKQIDD
jgi:hypothetical protein